MAYETLQIKINEITSTCFNWCKEQSFIHQQNIEIYEMSFIVIALISIVVNRTINSYWNYFKGQGYDDNLLEKIYDGTLTMIFVMLILFLIYMMWLR